MDEVHVELLANLIDNDMHASEGEFTSLDICHFFSSLQHASASQALSDAVEQAVQLVNPDKFTDMEVDAAITYFPKLAPLLQIPSCTSSSMALAGRTWLLQ